MGKRDATRRPGPCPAADGTFDIQNVPDGTYNLAVWDRPQNYLIDGFNITVAGGIPKGNPSGGRRRAVVSSPPWAGRPDHPFGGRLAPQLVRRR